ncbi:MAG: hypothetical protein ACEQSE_06950 [Candidatus Aquirickettsiella gammari]
MDAPSLVSFMDGERRSLLADFAYDACVTYTALLIALACFDCPPQFLFILIDELFVLSTIQLQADIRLGY